MILSEIMWLVSMGDAIGIIVLLLLGAVVGVVALVEKLKDMAESRKAAKEVESRRKRSAKPKKRI